MILLLWWISFGAIIPLRFMPTRQTFLDAPFRGMFICASDFSGNLTGASMLRGIDAVLWLVTLLLAGKAVCAGWHRSWCRRLIRNGVRHRK